MGLRWKNVETVPKDGYEIAGDPNAFSKRDWPWFAWRFQHQWQVFEVKERVKWYHAYFSDGKNKMRFRRKIRTRRFAARIGPRTTRFVCTGPDGKVLQIITIGEPMNYQQMLAEVADTNPRLHTYPEPQITMI